MLYISNILTFLRSKQAVFLNVIMMHTIRELVNPGVNPNFSSIKFKTVQTRRVSQTRGYDYPVVVVCSRSDFYHNRTSSHTLRPLHDRYLIIVAYWSSNRMKVADCCTNIVRPSYDSLHDGSCDRLRPSYDDRSTT